MVKCAYCGLETGEKMAHASTFDCVKQVRGLVAERDRRISTLESLLKRAGVLIDGELLRGGGYYFRKEDAVAVLDEITDLGISYRKPLVGG